MCNNKKNKTKRQQSQGNRNTLNSLLTFMNFTITDLFSSVFVFLLSLEVWTATSLLHINWLPCVCSFDWTIFIWHLLRCNWRKCYLYGCGNRGNGPWLSPADSETLIKTDRSSNGHTAHCFQLSDVYDMCIGLMFSLLPFTVSLEIHTAVHDVTNRIGPTRGNSGRFVWFSRIFRSCSQPCTIKRGFNSHVSPRSLCIHRQSVVWAWDGWSANAFRQTARRH